jgi:TP901 family phage tail tape measure protein
VAVGVTAVAAAVVATGAALGASVAKAADFEQQMSAVKAVSGATGAEMESLRGLALQLGKDTEFSALEAAQGIEELVKGGIAVKDIIGGGAAAAMTLAAAGGVSLANAANLAAIAANSFGISGAGLAHVADIVAGAANASTISVDDFRLSLAQVAAVANSVGFTIDETAQAIALLGKKGLVGSDAGTSLKQFIAGLTPATKTAVTAMTKLGIITKDGKNQFFDAKGEMKDFAQIAGILQKATAGLSTEQRQAALETIFGSDAIRAASIIAEEGAKGVTDIAAAMTEVKAADVAAARLDNLKGRLEQLRGAWETLLITIGTAFLPIVRKSVDATTAFINKIIDFEKATGTFQTGADAIATFLGALRGDWAGDAASNIHPLVLALGQIGLFIRAQVLPALSQLVAFIRAAFSGDAGATVGRFVDLVQGQQARLVAVLTQWGQAFINWITPMIPMMVAQLQIMMGQIGAWIAAQTPIFLEHFLTEWLPAFVDWLADAGEAALPHLTAFLDRITAWVQANGAPMLDAFIAYWTPKFTEWLASAALQIIPRLVAFQAEIIKWIATEGVPAFIQMGLDLGGAIINGIIQALQTATDRIRAALIQAGVPLPGSGVTVPVVPPGVTQRPPGPAGVTERPPVPTADPATQAQMIAIKTELIGVTEAMRAMKIALGTTNQTIAQTPAAFKTAASQLIGPY